MIKIIRSTASFKCDDNSSNLRTISVDRNINEISTGKKWFEVFIMGTEI